MSNKCENCGAPLIKGKCIYCDISYEEESVLSNNVKKEIITISPKSKWKAFLLCIFLGPYGAHHFYVGNYKMGLIYFFTVGLCAFGWFYDMYAILIGNFKDVNGCYLR